MDRSWSRWHTDVSKTTAATSSTPESEITLGVPQLGWRDNRLDCYEVVQSYLFQMNVRFGFHLNISVWRRSGESRVLEVQSEVYAVRHDLGSNLMLVLCVLSSPQSKQQSHRVPQSIS